jgi:hypothetical protein
MPRVDPQLIVDDWNAVTQGELLEKPAYVLAAERDLARRAELEQQSFFDWSPDELQRFGELVGQQRLELADEDKHANVRQAVAQFLERVVMPTRADPSIARLVEKLRLARRTGTYMYNRASGKIVTIVDDKAGLPLLCPDDARDEAARLQRRYVPALAEWRNSGKALHYAVFTTPNAAPGKLRGEMVSIVKRFTKIFRRGRGFPEVKGALLTLEAPLGGGRDWNVHVNVLLMCDGFLDYEKVRRAWHWDVHLERVRADRFDGETYEDAVRRSLRELAKYPVQAMPTKSEEKKRRRRDGRAPPPAMLEWTAAEWSEWWDAHSRFRRTRTYGELYAIDEPDPESLEGFEAVGTFWSEGQVRRSRFPLLNSITGDKSSGRDIRELAIEAFRKLFGPPGQLERVLRAHAIVTKHYGPVSLSV